MISNALVGVSGRDHQQPCPFRIRHGEQFKFVAVTDNLSPDRESVHRCRPEGWLTRYVSGVGLDADRHAEHAAPPGDGLGHGDRLGRHVAVGDRVVLRFTVLREDPHGLQAVPQHHGSGSCQLCFQVAEQGDSGHLGTVAVLIEAADSEHGVQILLGERFAEQHMGARHTGIEMADSRRSLRGRFEALEEIVEVLLLLLQCQVLDRVHELRTTDLRHRHRRERKSFQLRPRGLDPRHVAVDQTQDPRRDDQVLRTARSDAGDPGRQP